MEKIKNYATYIAGAAFLLYALLELREMILNVVLVMELRSVQQTFHSVISVFQWIALVVLGVTCLTQKAEGLRAVALLVPIVTMGLTLVMSILAVVMVLLGGEGISLILFNFVSMVSGVLRLTAYAVLFFFALMAWKKKESVLFKVWFMPAICYFLSGIWSFVASFLLLAEYGGALSLVVSGWIYLGTFVKDGILAIGMGALGLSCVPKKKTDDVSDAL